MSNTKQKFDIVIAGGGLSGALSALSLSQLRKKDGSPLSIAIVEANPIHRAPNTSYDARVLALSHGSAHYLNQLNVWGDIKESAAPIQKIHISDRGHYGKARVDAKDHQVNALGYVVEMSVLGKAFLGQLSTNKNITWFCPDHITDIHWHHDFVDIELNSAELICGHLLLACDGGQSTCRQFANISSTTKPYEQSALIANVSMEQGHQNIAYERFTNSGPIAILPLSTQKSDSNKCSLVWTLSPEQAENIASLNDDDFKKQLELAFGSWLGGVNKVGKRTIYPLNLVQANEQIYHRMALVGNASHTIHPIAGQGFNLGVRDVVELTTTIAENIYAQRDIAHFASLAQFAEQRKIDHQQVINLTDSLVTFFSNDLPPLIAGRNIGLKVLNYVKPLKNAFVNKTMGY